MGARNYGGAALFNLTVMKGADGKSGTLSGSFDLSTEQVDALKKGRLYLQVHSEGSPTGHLLGWLVKYWEDVCWVQISVWCSELFGNR